MKNPLASPLALLAAGALALSAAFTLSHAAAQGTQPGASPPVSAGAPIAIAVIDLEKTLELCKEGQDERARLKIADDANEAELRKFADKLKELGTRLDTMPRDDPQRRQVQEEYNGLLAQAKTRKDNIERETAIAYGSTMWRLYARIDDTVKRYAAENGLDAVLVYDELKPPRDPEKVSPTSVQTMSQSRQVLFRSDRLDITQKIVLRMNTEYAAAGGRPGAPAPGAQPVNNNAAKPPTPAAPPKGAPKKKGG